MAIVVVVLDMISIVLYDILGSLGLGLGLV